MCVNLRVFGVVFPFFYKYGYKTQLFCWEYSNSLSVLLSVKNVCPEYYSKSLGDSNFKFLCLFLILKSPSFWRASSWIQKKSQMYANLSYWDLNLWITWIFFGITKVKCDPHLWLLFLSRLLLKMYSHLNWLFTFLIIYLWYIFKCQCVWINYSLLITLLLWRWIWLS